MSLFPDTAPAQDGLASVKSGFAPKETADRLVKAVEAKGLTVFCRIDHQANAVSAGLQLRPTEVLIFGNAKGGTPLMQANQTMGIDLPLKALVWQDAAGQSWITCNDPLWLTARHGGIEGAAAAPAAAMRTLLSGVTEAAAMP
jgi:uncharacterized protein (DUF302 family)